MSQMYRIRRAVLEDGLAIHEAHMRSIREVCGPHYSEAEILAWGYRTYSPSKWSHSTLNALSFYKKLGFVQCGEQAEVLIGSTKIRCLRMELQCKQK